MVKTENYFSKIKESLLQSGMPLEVSTCRKLVAHKYIDYGEYYYERNDKSWSVDIHAINFTETPLNSKTGQIELLVECKHCRPGRNWYFFKFEKGIMGIGRERVNHTFIDLPIKEIIWKYSRKNNKTIQNYVNHIVPEFVFSPKRQGNLYPIASKGTELIIGSKRKKSQKQQNTTENKKIEEVTTTISHALYQLRYGATSLLIDSYKHYGTGFMENLLYTMIVPVLVTTAKLYYQKIGISLEEFQNFKDFDDIFQEVDFLIYHFPVDSELRNYIVNRYDLSGIKKQYRYTRRFNDNRLAISLIEPIIPNCFYIVNYNKLDEFIEEFEKNVFQSVRNILSNYQRIVDRLNKKWI